MVAYSIVMLLCSVAIFAIAFLFYKGNVHLMREYDQQKVKDKLAYGKALGKSYFIMSLSFLASGIVGLMGDKVIIVVTAVILLFIGLILGVCYFTNVREKFTAGFF